MMVAVILVVAVGAVAYTLLTQNQRVSRTQAQHAGLQDNVRSGALVVANELREVGYDSIPAVAGFAAPASVSPDLLTLEPGRVVYKAMRGIGFTCAPAEPGRLPLRQATLLGARPPEVDDSLTVFIEGDPATAADDAWVHAGIAAVTAGACEDGAAAVVLSVGFAAGAGGAAPARMVVGGPVRFFEVMELRYYQSGGKSWLGARSLTAGGVIEPMLGPLADSSGAVRGFTFTYLDRAGAPTTVANDVREIAWTLKGVTDGTMRRTADAPLAVDSLALSTSVALRNTLR